MDKEAQVLLDQIAGNTRTMVEEQKKTAEGLAAHVKSYNEAQAAADARFKRLEGRMVRQDSDGKEQRRRELSRGLISLPGLEDNLEKFSWTRAIRGVTTNDWSAAGFEKEVFDQTYKRTVNQTTNTQGGFLVPAELQIPIIEAFTKRAVVLRAGATYLSGLTGGNLEFNREDTVVEMAAQPEPMTSAITDSTPTLTQLVLSEKSAGALVFLTEKMLRNANQSVDAWIERQMAKAMARYLDKMALIGTGASNEPLGIMNDSGLQTLALSNTPLEFEDVGEMQTMLEEDDAWDDAGRPAMVWHPRVRNAMRTQRIRQFTGQTNSFGYTFGARVNNLQDVLGFPEYGSTQLNGTGGTADAILGNWEELIVAQWGNLEIQRSTDYRFGHGQVAIRALMGLDVGVRHDASFVVVTDAAVVPV